MTKPYLVNLETPHVLIHPSSIEATDPSSFTWLSLHSLILNQTWSTMTLYDHDHSVPFPDTTTSISSFCPMKLFKHKLHLSFRAFLLLALHPVHSKLCCSHSGSWLAPRYDIWHMFTGLFALHWSASYDSSSCLFQSSASSLAIDTALASGLTLYLVISLLFKGLHQASCGVDQVSFNLTEDCFSLTNQYGNYRFLGPEA